MLKKTALALGAAVVLVMALGSASYAQQSQSDWQRAYNSKAGKNCVGGSSDENAASAYPSWWTNCR
jgi:hypothetical protein